MFIVIGGIMQKIIYLIWGYRRLCVGWCVGVWVCEVQSKTQIIIVNAIICWNGCKLLMSQKQQMKEIHECHDQLFSSVCILRVHGGPTVSQTPPPAPAPCLGHASGSRRPCSECFKHTYKTHKNTYSIVKMHFYLLAFQTVWFPCMFVLMHEQFQVQNFLICL